MTNFDGGNAAVVEAQIPAISRAARVAEIARKLRQEFLDRGLFTQAMADDFGIVANVPMGVVSSAVFGARAADEAAAALVAGVQASIATPVEPEPAPVVAAPAVETPAPAVDELPPLADDVYAAAKPAVAPRPSLSDVRARLAAKARASQCTIVSLPTAPVSRPAPEPRPERVPGVGEFYCSACDHKHVIAAKDAWVHAIPWLEDHFNNVAPSFEQLAGVAVCGRASHRDRRLNWYPMVPVFQEIQRLVAEKAEHEAAKALTDAKRNLGGAAGRILAPKASKPEVARCVASTGPAKPRNETSGVGFGKLADWKAPTVK